MDDGAFTVWETHYGVWRSADRNGREMSTGGTKEGIIRITRWILKCEQEGYPEGSVRIICDAYMGGKL